MPRYRIDIIYEGTKYRGWQRLKQTEETIQGKIERVLSKHFQREIKIDGAGRTDAGVHAKAQVATFDADETDVTYLSQHLNTFLPEDIVVWRVQKVDPRFHARFSAIDKTYVYTLWRASYPPVFERKYVTVVKEPLDIDLMRAASTHFVGCHDFKGFTTDKTKKSTIRTLEKIDFEISPEKVMIYFTGDGFLYNMVRILAGTLMEIGMGYRKPESILEVFQKGDRALAGPTAPAQGLMLWHIQYDEKRE